MTLPRPAPHIQVVRCAGCEYHTLITNCVEDGKGILCCPRCGTLAEGDAIHRYDLRREDGGSQ